MLCGVHSVSTVGYSVKQETKSMHHNNVQRHQETENIYDDTCLKILISPQHTKINCQSVNCVVIKLFALVPIAKFQ